MSILSTTSVLVTGGTGFLGRSVIGSLRQRGLPPDQIFAPTRGELDLLDVRSVDGWFAARGEHIGAVIHCAGLVGGLGLNRSRPADMLCDNVRMTLNLVRAAAVTPFGPGHAHTASAARAVVLVGSMTSYPADAPLPYREESLFRGLPDAEIAPYGIGKLTGLMHLQAAAAQHGIRGAFPIPSNLYGPGDNLHDPAVSHVAGALIKRFVDAATSREPEVVCWGTGAPTRDFVFVEDAAEGVVRCAEWAMRSHVTDAAQPRTFNIASGREVTIRELAETIARLTGFAGAIMWDASKGDGVSRRCLDVSRAQQELSWQPRVGLEEGLRRTIEWYRATRDAVR